MPYTITKQDGKFFVFTKGDDGRPTGEARNKTGYDTKAEALPLLKALYAAMHKTGDSVSELDLTILSPDGLGLNPVVSQESVHYTTTSPFSDKSCGTCSFYSGANYCYLVASQPLMIVPDGYCNDFTELQILADPQGVMQMTAPSGVIHEMNHDLPIASGDPAWDAAAARQRIWTWATDQDGNLDIAKAAQAFLVRGGDTKGDLKDPIADVLDGHLEVIPAALRAAASRLPQTDGDGTHGAASVLAAYQKKAHIGELQRAALEDFVISEYKGSVPDVPDAPGVDKKALTEGDPKPTFVVRPIAQVGRTSKNGILYDQALIDSIREQIVQNHPIGIFGHIKEADRATAHPTPQAYWIGAIQYGDKLYAKAYIADMERAADIRRKKALNSADGTSIYGTGIQHQHPDGTISMTKFTLESLDFAPVDRASLDMGKEMYITSEMTPNADSLTMSPPATAGNPDPDNDGDNDLLDPDEGGEMTQVIDPMVTMTSQWKTMSPDAVCEQMSNALGEMMGKVAEAYLAKNKMKAVAAEMEAVAPSVITEMNQQKVTVAELQATVTNFQRREFEGALAAEIARVTPCPSAEDKLVKATAETRGILELKARLALKDSIDTSKIVETVSAVVADSPAIMEMWRDTLMGPAARIAGLDNHTPSQSSYYLRGVDVNDPKFQEEARARVGA